MAEAKYSKGQQDAARYRKQKFDPALLLLLDASEEAWQKAEVDKGNSQLLPPKEQSVETLPCKTLVKI